MDTLTALRSGQLMGATRINISAGLTEFPLDLLQLKDSLEVLDLSNNQLRSLPDDLSQFTRLQALFCYNNRFETIPEVVARCPNLSILGFRANQIHTLPEAIFTPHLRWLILTQNHITQIPATLGRCQQLQKLLLAGNQLRSLPGEVAHCHNLELIRLAANRLDALPDALLHLPKLAWLAYAGNPFCLSGEGQGRSLRPIDWADLTLGEVLGQGASGVISKATWHDDPPRTVAVKVFKGQLTSDGFPADEMNACITAGNHLHLVTLLGQLANHPEQRQGLVFDLIPPGYRALAGPPNLETCTRDTYRPDQIFTLTAIVNIGRGVAAAAAHLHERGILHGDLYPHNTLANDWGESLLSDFGAASLYDRRDRAVAEALEHLEVRAFGCLLEDLLTRCSPDDLDRQEEAIAALHRLQQACVNPTPLHRPSFTEIYDTLIAIDDAQALKRILR
jgi:hypothetical protein